MTQAPPASHATSLLLHIVAMTALAIPAAAFAQGRSQADLEPLRQELARQAQLLERQQQQLDSQAHLIDSEKAQIAALQAARDEALESIRATGVPRAGSGIIQLAQTDPSQRAQDTQSDPGSRVTRPVGEAPPQTPDSGAVAAALPQPASVVTPRGHLVVDPSLEYDRSSSNRLVFRGVEIVPGVNLGLVDANAADRDTGVGAVDLRYGLTRRLEIEARVPYVYRHDQLTVLSQQVTNSQAPISQSQSLNGKGLGDVELAARYQLNTPHNGGPFFIAGVRVKTRSGVGPYDVSFDNNGVTQTLATGSGFWGVEPSLTMLLPSDPVVIYATVGYLNNIARNINRDLPSAGSASVTHIGKAEPGDSINASVGFGFALNDRFSFSLGYSHSAVMATTVQLNGSSQKSSALQVGALTMGWSYRLRPDLTLNNSFEFGVTSDAPNLRIVTRLPVSF